MIAILLRAAGCLIGLLIAAAPAGAAIITVDYAGVFSGNNIPGINAGGAGFSGSFTIDTGLLTVTSGALQIPSVPFTSGPVAAAASSVLEVIDGDGANGEADSLLIEFRPAAGVAWPPGGTITFWSVNLVDNEGTAFPPTFPPDLPGFAAWDVRSFSMRVDGPCDPPSAEPCAADGNLTSFAVQSVPEPASMPLLISALAIGLWFAGRRRPQRI